MGSNVKETIANKLHAPARKQYPQRHVDICGLDETWQADLVDLLSSYLPLLIFFQNLLGMFL